MSIPAFHPTLQALEAVDLDTVQPFLLPRSASRKAQAVAARALFKALGLRDISVTVPVYSMAQGVRIRIPDGPRTPEMEEAYLQAKTHEEEQATELLQVRRRREAIRRHLDAILDRAFPHHLDRSDLSSDHFDFCWMVD